MKRYTKILLVIAEIGVVVWAVHGMFLRHNSIGRACDNILSLGGNCEYSLTLTFIYFFSAVLILYLLRKYEN
ncbi:hypothetical protein A2641_00790 [Candidatus Nomurabacteria bacterium RIFCSPHIGHO2_01_FULL_37_25]|uniref:Uncharacterized protein n=1 Tax=Candidatus Nomurabacteria bacterium RIFCSPLOWO2_01_FULL_36_16 TaxID=1801767 RepID=A0A1F6WXM2_9BACT|nr:MAG: hypothetical protein A2641_00790 [Candidatus Nomurabacteria bacterium RIFCSPHIGHO2_01_FULL_37_25]OGI74933.1 MAG: hypothetical protein A3D36_01395 [Candidatus Nomurabacteria bacterium RIFCSPHIGHO2_02_FULL_36_29]OGI86647.1 MAG: hypothetical protein A3A91_02960 [Candidatus Nomurabacteria bacterium RIFCSPLOWO2_01_FULL_36_16]OGI94711.1 MAG: hypothetical protein A3I84_00220 [Candidatus Nomurabacteria bacterium RIFCSPLOWO2_02_FULL_36_8]